MTVPADAATPLHDAVKRRDLRRLRELLAAGRDPNQLDAEGQPPLRYVLSDSFGFCLEDATREMIRLLRRAGADPKVANVGASVIKDAHDMVTGASELADASELETLLA